jgi:hypothetical protein
MALLKKSTSATAEPFRVPSLADVDDVYAGLLTKRGELNDKSNELRQEKRALEKIIAADTSREVRPAIAELLGDAPGTKALNRKRLAEVRAEIADVESAQTVVEQRLRDAKGAASIAVCARVRPEYAKRVQAMVAAAKALDEAHRSYDELRYQFDVEDVSWMSLIPMTPAFLGASNEPDRRLARFVREAEEAGYAG